MGHFFFQRTFRLCEQVFKIVPFLIIPFIFERVHVYIDPVVIFFFFFNLIVGSMFVRLLVFRFENSKFHQNKPIAIKFQHVVRLQRLVFPTKNYHCVVHTFFTGSREKFGHVTLYYFLKISRIVRKFKYSLKVENITYMLRIIIVPCIDFAAILQKF